ncbi:MAG TPA: hypothetical protein VGU71_16920 [Candidatus Dormibacteraeota bacterium]|nr:hypothetical protein [Candidatus Dormibacteraeota bacterium]
MPIDSSVEDSRTTRTLVLVAAVGVLVGDAVYLWLISTQSAYPPDAFTIPFVAGYVALMAAMLGLSLMRAPLLVKARPAFRAGSAAGLLVMGVLALFSIGLPFVISGGLATGAAVRTLAGRPRRQTVITEVAAAVIALVVLVAGFEVTERLIVCPAHGVSGGSGYGLVTGGYHWQCVDGRLTFASGFCSNQGGGIDANGHAFSTSNC